MTLLLASSLLVAHLVLTGIPYTGYLNTAIVVSLAIFAIHTLMKSRHGRYSRRRDNEVQLEASGVNTTYYKTRALFSLHSLLVLQAAFTRAASAL